MDEYTVEILRDDHRGFSFPVRTKANSLLVDPGCIPREHIVEWLNEGRTLTVQLGEYRQSLSMTYIAPDSTRLFLMELESILKELSQQRYVWYFPTTSELLFYVIAKEAVHKVCSFVNAAMHAKRMQREHGLYTRQDKLQYIARTLDYQQNWGPDELEQLLLGLARLDLVYRLNPMLDIPSRLKEDQNFAVMALGNVTFRADELLPYAVQDKLYINWHDSHVSDLYTSWIAGYLGDFSSQFRTGQIGDYLTLQVAIHPQWKQSERGIELNLDYRKVLDLYEVPYLMYQMDDDGNLYVGGHAEPLEVKWDIDLDIKCDDDEIYKLYVPLLETDSLDMMVGTPVRFRDYFLYSGFSNVVYPVNIRLRSPMETMFVLDRLATMLTTGMVIKDVSLQINDGNGGTVERRYTQPWILASLITQLLFRQKPPATLNECAYRLLRMMQIWGKMEEHPWSKVTVDGYRDDLNIASLGNPPLLARSHDSLDEYITERVALMHACSWFETDDRPRVGLSKVR